jgi:Cof subfamily protein (haloacid dehalogenase superfamily)
MSIKLIASDLDGTIVDKNYNVSEKNIKAFTKIQKRKIPFVICTGKSYAVSQKSCKKFHATYGIFGNGTQIIDLKAGKELYKHVITKEDLLFVSTMAKRYGFHIHLYTDEEIVTEKLEFMDLRNYIIRNQENNEFLKFKFVDSIIDYIEKNETSVFSAIISSENIPLLNFRKMLIINKNIDCTFINKRGVYRDKIIDKDYEYINITPTNINKNEALNFLSTFLDIDKKDILAIGDNINDYEMIRDCGIGVAVNESMDNIKEVANYVTTSSTKDGAFAEAIDKFL